MKTAAQMGVIGLVRMRRHGSGKRRIHSVSHDRSAGNAGLCAATLRGNKGQGPLSCAKPRSADDSS